MFITRLLDFLLFILELVLLVVKLLSGTVTMRPYGLVLSPGGKYSPESIETKSCVTFFLISFI